MSAPIPLDTAQLIALGARLAVEGSLSQQYSGVMAQRDRLLQQEAALNAELAELRAQMERAARTLGAILSVVADDPPGDLSAARQEGWVSAMKQIDRTVQQIRQEQGDAGS